MLYPGNIYPGKQHVTRRPPGNTHPIPSHLFVFFFLPPPFPHPTRQDDYLATPGLSPESCRTDSYPVVSCCILLYPQPSDAATPPHARTRQAKWQVKWQALSWASIARGHWPLASGQNTSGYTRTYQNSSGYPRIYKT